MDCYSNFKNKVLKSILWIKVIFVPQHRCKHGETREALCIQPAHVETFVRDIIGMIST